MKRWNSKKTKGFSRAQQPEFRTMAAKAWAAHCLAEGVDIKSAAKRAWYEGELLAATGHESSTDCNAGRDYDDAMAHFETLAGDGIKWQMRVYSGDKNRLLHVLSEVCDNHGVDGEYLNRVCRNGFGHADFHLLEPKELITILGELKRFVRRKQKREATA